MNDKEKLVDLMADIIDFVAWEHLEATADHLIANGVVIRKEAERVGVDRRSGHGICSNCNRLDEIDSLATHCRYCGAKMKEVK